MAPSEDPDRAEGMAGLAWSHMAAVSTGKMAPIDATSSDKEIEFYAKKTHVQLEWLRERLTDGRKCAVDLCAFPVEVHGRPWGVIVIDSKVSEIDVNKVDGLNKQFAKIIGSLLERA